MKKNRKKPILKAHEIVIKQYLKKGWIKMNAREKAKINQLEAQLKAKESDLERQDMIIKCLNIDLDNKEKLLKAKDKEIMRLNNLYADTIKEVGKLDEDYSKVASDFESAVMEIDRLKAQLSSVHNLMYRTKHKPNAKARSIVAMLFWEWKKLKQEKEYDMAESARCCFGIAYKMLKEQQ